MPDHIYRTSSVTSAFAPEPIAWIYASNNRFFAASGKQIFELVDGVWRPMAFEAPEVVKD